MFFYQFFFIRKTNGGTSKTRDPGFELTYLFDNPQKSENMLGFFGGVFEKKTPENPKQHILGKTKKTTKKPVWKLSNFQSGRSKWTPQSVSPETPEVVGSTMLKMAATPTPFGMINTYDTKRMLFIKQT